MGREIELKYAVPDEPTAAALLAWDGLRGLIRERTVIDMRTDYFDTPAKALSARRWTLRRRLENGVSVVCMKTAAVGAVRGEWEVAADDVTAALPELIRRGAPEALAGLCQGGLAQVCGAAFERTALLLDPGSGCCCELALDRGVLRGGDRTLPLLELELEHKTGDPAATFRFADALAAAFSLRPEPRSKFVRANELAERTANCEW